MSYDDFINELYSLQDLKYKEFHSKLILSDNLIGVRTPELKRLAKMIAKGDYESFFRNNKHITYEEKVVHGLTLGYLNLNYDELKTYIDSFIKYIDNWAICDLTVANLKIYNKNKNIEDIKKYIYNDNHWINRFGYVLLLEYFIEEKYIEDIFKLCENYKDEYYIKMSIAWLISMCYIKFKDKTIKFLKSEKLDVWTHNKAIQKIIDSNRVSKNEKMKLRSLKK